MKSQRTLFLLALAALLCGGTLAEAQPVHGYVDLHSHLMAEHSFGGGWYSGTLEGPMDVAVQRCDGNFPGNSHAATVFPVVSEFLGADTGWHLGKRRGYDRRQCSYFLGIPIPGTCPQPHFEHWPMWNAIAHQQMWHGWLKQAHQGGMRIMVVSLAESNFLCLNTAYATRRYDCDEMASIRRQLNHLNGFVSRNGSWVGIATSPAAARSLIQQGKLALVLSVEVTRLFPSGDFITQLDELRGLGVRSMQVVHHADNRFAGAAPIPKLMSAATLTETLWGYDMTRINDIVCRDSAGASGKCNGNTRLNERGLTAEGSALIRAMMDRGMVVDVAHLSRKAFSEAYQIAQQRGNYPLLYSHAHMWNTVSSSEERHEKYILPSEIQMITNTGGMVGLRTGPESTVAYGTSVSNSCQGSARSFAQSLMYAVDNGLTVGFGADLNGFTEQLKPRYAPTGCFSDYVQINNAGGPNDLHNKGLAHVGLLPQLMSDLQSVGTPSYYVDHLNRSAENFLRMWERGVSLSTPINRAPQASTSASSTFCSGTGDHCYSATRVNDGNRSTALSGTVSWANANGAAMPQWVELSWGSPVTTSRVDLYTSTGYEIRDYDIQVWTSAGWTSVVVVTGNTSVSRSHTFSPVTTTRLRVLGRRGPNVQPGYVRVNEVEVY
jgi:microsomal dipeptidase-like Zn-dependent dipeptidase